MSWEWSHTNEAYAYAQDRVNQLPRKELLTILREWTYEDRDKAGTLVVARGKFSMRGFRLPNGIRKLPTDLLAQLVWERAENHRTCSNGGWQCYVCPDGCHTVPFGPED